MIVSQLPSKSAAPEIAPGSVRALEVPRILIVDDTRAIHDDFSKILATDHHPDLERAEAALFGGNIANNHQAVFTVASAYQGDEALKLVTQAVHSGANYALAFVDVRMPPGWDGIETTAKLWAVDPDLQIVICTAYSDHSWENVMDRLGHHDNLVILKKPFDAMEVLQLAHALTRKWQLTRRHRRRLAELEARVAERTAALETANHQLRDEITESRQREERMNLQVAALNAAANAIVIANSQGLVEWVNPAFTRLSGYGVDEIVGQPLRILKSGQHPPSFYANLWTTITTGNVWHGEIISKRKDGRFCVEDMTITPVRGSDNLIRHFVAIKQDITEQRQFQTRLQQAQKMEAIGTLAGGIAHDFNNVLAAIFGYGDLLRQDLKGHSEAREDVEEILKAARRAKDLVEQILTFSRQREHKRQVIRVDKVVTEALKFLRASVPASIQIVSKLSADAPPILADPTQIYQITLNLVTNSLHAMEGRNGRMTIALETFRPEAAFIQAHPEFRPIDYVLLSVADTGHGMDAQTLERIFEPFFTTKPAGLGTGLGLAVVLGIVQSHGGGLTVESTVGEGTTFRLYFPTEDAPTPANDPAPGDLPLGNSQRILLIDDEAALTDSLQKLLTRLNYRVTASNTAPDGLTTFFGNPPQFDLVITNLGMPEINGLEVARQIHAIRPQLPILLITGFAPDVRPENLAAVGICELLQKPVSLDVLAETLRRTWTKPPQE